MKIFILEDDPTRIMWLRKRLIDHDCTFIDSCNQIDQFKPPYDLILLDHDLGGRQLEDHEDSGTRFAELVEGKLGSDAIVIFHSYNADGAKRMREILGNRGYIAPFRGPFFNNLIDKVLSDGQESFD